MQRHYGNLWAEHPHFELHRDIGQLDPHGVDAKDVIQRWPAERLDNVVWFDPDADDGDNDE